MIPASFDESDCVADAPDGSPDVDPLSVYRGFVNGNQPVLVSCWKPTAEELIEINLTGRVWLVVMGDRMQPVMVEGHRPHMTERAIDELDS